MSRSVRPHDQPQGFIMANHIPISNISQDDIVIALMGPTGAGKSMFIDIATLQDANHSLRPYTSDIRAVRFPHPTTGRPVILVDTPGFNSATKTDTEVLSIMARWLEHTYKNHVKLTGIIYFHRISDNRMAGAPLRDLQMFTKLCGDEALPSVILTTTMWSHVKPDIAERRNLELHNKYWRPMLQRGSQSCRFEDTFDSAWSIIDSIVAHTRDARHALLLQRELVDLHRPLSETQVGMTLYNELQKSLVEQRETIRKLRENATSQDNELAIQELTSQYELLQQTLEKTFGQLDKMKMSLGKHLKSWLTFRKVFPRSLNQLYIREL